MKKLSSIFFTALLFLFLLIQSSFACTDVRLQAKDGTVMIARSMEFGTNMQSNLRSSPRGRAIVNKLSNDKEGLSWQGRYGYVFLDGLNQDITIDGMNEVGLSFEYLYLPGETQYPTLIAGKEASTLPYYHFGDWVLGNFRTVDEVRAALANITVIGATLPGFNMILPAHAAIYDQSGKGIIVEFVGGQMYVYNSIGILTNSPVYPWHVNNLRNYLNLSPYVPKTLKIDGITYAATGQGSGMVGLPGDYSPPSRFVKASVLATTSVQAKDAMEALNIAQHILNNFDIAAGVIRDKESGQDAYDTTQWVVFKDLTHLVFYYRTYNDMTIRYVSFDKVNLATGSPRLKMPIAETPYLKDVTNQFSQQKD